MPAFYIMLQEKIPGVDATGIEGRALCKHSDELEALARQAGVVFDELFQRERRRDERVS